MALGRRNLKNNWSTALDAPAAAADTTLSLPQAWIDKLTSPNPSSTQWYELTLDDGVQAPEIVRCTGKGTGTVTVVRQQQGTVAPTTWGAGTKVEIRITAELTRPLEWIDWDLTQHRLAIGYAAGDVAGTPSRALYIGQEADAASTGMNDVIAIGYRAKVHTPNTAVLGSHEMPLEHVYIGSGQRGLSSGVTLHATGGSGSDSYGADLRLAGGTGTGTGGCGRVLIATAPQGTVFGETEAVLQDRAEWDTEGLFWTYAGLKTGDPGNGAGTWKLGTVRAGAVTLDAANYVEVDIDGNFVKLLKAA